MDPVFVSQLLFTYLTVMLYSGRLASPVSLLSLEIQNELLLMKIFLFYPSSLRCTESSPRTAGPSPGDDWRSAFDAAANGSVDSSRFGSSHSRRYSDPAQNGDVSSGSNHGGRRTPNRLPPAPPQTGSAYRY